MRRLAKRLIILLAFGVALNIAVAWACAYFSEPRAFDPRLLASVRREMLEQKLADSAGRQVTMWPSMAYPGFGMHFIDIDVQTEGVTVDAFRGPWRRIGIVRCGW